MTKKYQKDVYDELYSNKDYEKVSLPDYKITGQENLKDKKILILGIGSARDTKYLAKNNEVWGVDNSKKAISLVKKYGITGILADLDKPIKLKKGYFDIVVAKDILEHLSDPAQMVVQIRGFLKKDGYAVINVPNHFFILFRLRMLFGKGLIWKSPGHDHTKLFKEWNYMHKIFFTWKGFQEFLKEKGFKISKTFWDFGDLSHYSQPETVINYLRQSKSTSKFFIRLLDLLWKVFNIILPRDLRSWLVSLSPALLASSFYVWCTKQTNQS